MKKRITAAFAAIAIWMMGMMVHASDVLDHSEADMPSLTEYWKNKKHESQSVTQLTKEDILRMNDGDASFLFSEDGYLTFLRGKYYEEPVTDYEKGIESLWGIVDLLGFDKDTEFFAVYGEKDYFGYTSITYKQRYGDITLQNAVLKIILDPQGYTAGLVCSFSPKVGAAPEEEFSITAKEAEEKVLMWYPQDDLQVFSEYTRQTSVTINDVAYHAWAVFTNYPTEEGAPTGPGYLEHLVAYDGSYLMYMAVSSPEELVLGDNAQEELALSWFYGLEESSYTGTVNRVDGTKETITVPTAYDPNTGIYYLADVKRHILLADYYDMVYKDEYTPWTTKDNTGWPEHYLHTYNTYLKVYDFYSNYGIQSVDGFGAPVLILTDYCDADKKPKDNACYMGMRSGWAMFAASSVNDYGECVDVIAHEFTHGVTNYTLSGDLYENASGAVNEGLSDIMGNLCEMILGETEDRDWLMAESSGRAVRSMSSPSMYRQPEKLGGRYYQEPTDQPSLDNDLGGVHVNNSLISHAAWKLCDQGMGVEDAFYLWREASTLLTPKSGYQEMHQALLFAAKIVGLDETWCEKIDRTCREMGY